MAPVDGAVAAFAFTGERALCRASRRANGEFRGRAHQSRRGPARDAGFAADRRGDRLRRTRADAGFARFYRPLKGEGRHSSPDGVAVAGRRPFAPAPDRGTRPHRRRGGCAGGGACFSRRPRYAAPGRLALFREIRSRCRGARQPCHRDRQRPLLCDGSRQALGPGRTRLPGYRRRRGRDRGPCGGGIKAAYRAAKPTSLCGRQRSADIAACGMATDC